MMKTDVGAFSSDHPRAAITAEDYYIVLQVKGNRCKNIGEIERQMIYTIWRHILRFTMAKKLHSINACSSVMLVSVMPVTQDVGIADIGSGILRMRADIVLQAILEVYPSGEGKEIVIIPPKPSKGTVLDVSIFLFGTVSCLVAIRTYKSSMEIHSRRLLRQDSLRRFTYVC